MTARLVYLHNSPIPVQAANNVHVMRMCAAFAEMGRQVTLVIPESPETKGTSPEETRALYGGGAPFDIVRIPAGPLKSVGFAWAAARHARRLKPDLVYGRCARSCAAAAMLKLPVAFEAHGPLPAFARLGRMAVRSLARSSALRRFVVISGALRDYYASAFPSLRDRLLVAHDGADPPPAAPARPTALPPPRSGRLRAVYAGSLYRGKGMEVIEALAPALPEFDFLVAGGEGELLAHWRERLAGQDNVTMLGHLPHADVAGLISVADIALAPYLRAVLTVDGKFDAARWMSPLKLFEYMAQGKPIVASDLPVLREILDDGRTALLCDPGRPVTWVEAMRRLGAEAELRASLGAAARDTFDRSHSWAMRARRLLAAADQGSAAA